jgi:hypothetical protein
MARGNRKQKSKSIRYFFLNEKIHKTLRVSRAKDELVAWCYPEKRRVMYNYSQVVKYMGHAYSLKDASAALNKHKITLEDYIIEGKIKQPAKIYPIGNPESDWSMYMLTESDILNIHEFILEDGYSKTTPTRSELLALLKHNMILYTKTDGGFVPVWKAE